MTVILPHVQNWFHVGSLFRKLGQMTGCSSLFIMLPAAPERLRKKKKQGMVQPDWLLALLDRLSESDL